MSVFSSFFFNNHKVQENKYHIACAVEWLKVAQNRKGDAGFSGWHSLVSGWSPSYIETTGYIISTFLDASKYLGDVKLIERAGHASDFLLSMQLTNGAFRRHVPQVSKRADFLVFNTGQDILGLLDIYKETKKEKYLDSCVKAADWLVAIQENDGSWVKHTFGGIPHTYHTRVSWALLEVYKTTGKAKYNISARKNLNWALSNQTKSGWFTKNSLPDQKSDTPYTHTISYAMEGLLWSGILLEEEKYINATRKTADMLLAYYRKHDFLPGTFDKNWKSNDKFSCLTGDAQISIVWLKLYQITKDEKYLNSARRLNCHLKELQNLETKNSNFRGALPGSNPIYGDLLRRSGYCRLCYLNWSTKFFIDALILEDLLVNEHKNSKSYLVYKI